MTGHKTPCIWCKKTGFKPSREHILPEALGCPPGFDLGHCVCEPCNKMLGHRVDQAVLREFEIMTFVLGIGRKKGRRPSIDGWPSIVGAWVNGAPELHINSSREKVGALGRGLIPAHPSHGIANVQITVDGDTATMSFTQNFGIGRKFRRGIYKIALGSIAYFEGAEYAASSLFDPVRDFVKHGHGDFRAIVLGVREGRENEHEFAPSFRHPDHTEPMVGMAILGIQFMVDMSPGQRGLDMVIRKLDEEHPSGQWTILPVPEGLLDPRINT